MNSWYRNTGFLILLLIAGQAAAQLPVLDSVCYGATRNYRVDGMPGSTYTWILTDPVGAVDTLPSDADTLKITWNYPSGSYVLQVLQHSVDGCDADPVFGQVLIFDAPDVYAGPDTVICVLQNFIYLINSTAINTASLLWTTVGDGTFDLDTTLHPVYRFGPLDKENGSVTLTLTGYGQGDPTTCPPAISEFTVRLSDEIVPVFDTIGPLCQYSTPPPLPDTSLNGIVGIWNPPFINTNVPGTVYHIFTPTDTLQCGVEVTKGILIVTEIIPEFDTIGPLCHNSTPPALPDTSLNGLTGTWYPDTISTATVGTFPYTFTPDAGQCGVVVTINIAILTEIPSVFDPIGPFCQNSIPPELPDTSLNGFTGTWYPDTINTTVVGGSYYTFIPDPGQCAAELIIEIIILPYVVPLFDPIGPICQNYPAPALPDTSLNGLTGTWDPDTISTATPGTFTYTFTPDPGVCGIDTIVEITILPEIIPLFDPYPPFCQGSEPPELPDMSLNGIPGYWTPAVINTSVPGTWPYIFTPTAPEPCIVEVTIWITILPSVIPEFDPIGPLCQYSTPPPLPDTSLNGIEGTWEPPVINTNFIGSFAYTFTPEESDSCISEVILWIPVVEEIVPLFDSIGPLCQNSIPPLLPDTSLNGITGTWDPPVISTNLPGIFEFIFMPDNPEQCGVDTTISIEILPEVIPVFDPIDPLCQYSVAPALPDISLNGITGIWDPPVISTTLPGNFDFTFTPDDPTQCGVETIIEITVLPEMVPEFDSIGPLCHNSVPPELPLISLNAITGTWDPPGISTSQVGISNYTFTPDSGQCAAVKVLNVLVVEKMIPEFDPMESFCQYSIAPALPDSSVNGISGSWEPPVIITTDIGFTVYTFTPDTGQCAAVTTIAIEVTDPPHVIQLNVTNETDDQNNGAIEIIATGVTPNLYYSINGGANWQTNNGLFENLSACTYQCVVMDDNNCDTNFFVTVINTTLTPLQAITGPDSLCLGNVSTVPVRVNHFISVAEFQMKLSYNVENLLCEGYTNPHPQLAANLTATVNQSSGEIMFRWQSAVPVTFAGQETVAELVFSTKQAGQGQLDWYTTATDSYFINLEGKPIPVEFYAGVVTIYEPPVIMSEKLHNVCEGQKYTIPGIAYSTHPPVTYQWTYPDGHVEYTDPFFLAVTEADQGLYSLLVTDTLGCTDEQTIRLIVSENPVALFHGTDTLTVESGYILSAGSGQATYKWNTGDTTESMTITAEGMYRVDMVSPVGCIGADSIYILLDEFEPGERCLFIPNAFSPNGDGLNDTFRPHAREGCLSAFRMQIFDRWGDKLFETDDITVGWDGTKNGVEYPGDAYVYKIVYRTGGSPGADWDKIKTGALMLVR